MVHLIELFIIIVDDDDDDSEEIELIDKGGETKKKKIEPSAADYFMHFLSVPWKLAFATIPPTGLFANRNPTFFKKIE